MIEVTWDPPMNRNGILTMYTVRFRTQSTVESMSMDVPSTDTSLTLNNLRLGDTYIIDVAAHNGAGMGPFSGAVSQLTIFLPPELSATPDFQVNQAESVTQTSIPITLPDISDLSQFR